MTYIKYVTLTSTEDMKKHLICVSQWGGLPHIDA